MADTQSVGADDGQCSAKCPPANPAGNAECFCSPMHRVPPKGKEQATCANPTEGRTQPAGKGGLGSSSGDDETADEGPGKRRLGGMGSRGPAELDFGAVTGAYSFRPDDHDARVKSVAYMCQSWGAHCTVRLRFRLNSLRVRSNDTNCHNDNGIVMHNGQGALSLTHRNPLGPTTRPAIQRTCEQDLRDAHARRNTQVLGQLSNGRE